MRALIALLLLFVLGLLLLLAGRFGVSASVGDSGRIEFKEIFNERSNDEMRLVSSHELDVDEDGQDEWVVFYQYDPFEGQEWDSTPIQGIVYDAEPCDPPVMHTWRLPHFDNDYLGEGGQIQVEMADVLPSDVGGDAVQELVVRGNADKVNTLNIFRFHDYRLNPECKGPDDTQQGFTLVGTFRANGTIGLDEGSRIVTTRHRTNYERSQLAIRSSYAPTTVNGSTTFIDANGQPVNPVEKSVDFLFDRPRSPTDSPYPEKAVAAFYLQLGTEGDNEAARSYLADSLRDSFGSHTYGTDLYPNQLKRVLIYSISYEPDREAELAHQDRIVRLVIVPIDANNQRLPAREVTWRLIGIPIPNEQDCEWRLAELIGETVTDGLGRLPTDSPLAAALAHGD